MFYLKRRDIDIPSWVNRRLLFSYIMINLPNTCLPVKVMKANRGINNNLGNVENQNQFLLLNNKSGNKSRF